MGIDLVELARRIFEALKGQLGEKSTKTDDYAKSEARRIAETIAQIEKLVQTGDISEEDAKFLLLNQIENTKAMLLMIKGIGILTVESAINSAIYSVRDTVNAQVGFRLMG